VIHAFSISRTRRGNSLTVFMLYLVAWLCA
jgi:hypothetical protein